MFAAAKKKMITFRSATPRPTAWVIFRRKFTAVHHYLLHSPSSTPFASMFTKETKRASRRQVRKERKKERGGTRFVPSSLSLSIYSPLFLPSRFVGLASLLARSERTSLARIHRAGLPSTPPTPSAV